MRAQPGMQNELERASYMHMYNIMLVLILRYRDRKT